MLAMTISRYSCVQQTNQQMGTGHPASERMSNQGAIQGGVTIATRPETRRENRRAIKGGIWRMVRARREINRTEIPEVI